MFFCCVIGLGICIFGLYFVLGVLSVMDKFSPPLTIMRVVLLVFPHPLVVVFLVMLFSFGNDFNQFLFADFLLLVHPLDALLTGFN